MQKLSETKFIEQEYKKYLNDIKEYQVSEVSLTLEEFSKAHAAGLTLDEIYGIECELGYGNFDTVEEAIAFYQIPSLDEEW